MPRKSRTDLVQEAELEEAAGGAIVGTAVGPQDDTEETGLPDLSGIQGTIRQLDNESAISLAIQELHQLVEEIKALPNLEVGDRVIYHETNGDLGAFVQKIYKDGNIRLQVLRQMGMSAIDGVPEGTEIGMWSRRKNGV